MRRSLIALSIAWGCAGVALIAIGSGTRAQTPPPADATGTATVTVLVPTPTGTAPAAAETPMLTPPPTQGGFAVKVQLIEDTNQNGIADTADSTPAQTVVSLVAWVNPTVDIVLITGNDGTFSFENLPVGDYTLRLYWPGGFAPGLAPDHLPDILRAVFRVTKEGTLETPDPLPLTWPGLPAESFDPVNDRTLVGFVPDKILLREKDPGVIAVGPHIDTGATAVGSIDVAAALQGSAPIRLPSTGGGDTGARTVLSVVAGVALSLAAAGAIVLRQRRA